MMMIMMALRRQRDFNEKKNISYLNCSFFSHQNDFDMNRKERC